MVDDPAGEPSHSGLDPDSTVAPAVGTEDAMKIAWRYQNNPQIQVGVLGEEACSTVSDHISRVKFMACH